MAIIEKIKDWIKKNYKSEKIKDLIKKNYKSNGVSNKETVIINGRKTQLKSTQVQTLKKNTEEHNNEKWIKSLCWWNIFMLIPRGLLVLKYIVKYIAKKCAHKFFDDYNNDDLI